MEDRRPPRRILITGASGQVGNELVHTLAPLGELVAPSHSTLDLADSESIRRVMRDVRPHWIVNAAAYTGVDKAESEAELAFAINASAPAILAAEGEAIGAVMVHFSTDYVFDGSKPSRYIENDATGPLNVYGRSKLAGETALEKSGTPTMIFRTSWVYGSTGRNFLLSILRMAQERDHLRIVADQHGTPTWSRDLARMTADAIERVEQSGIQRECSLAQAAAEFDGIYHASGSGETTWFGFAESALVEWKKRKPEVKLASIQPIPTSEYPTPAQRPMNSRMDCSKLEKTFGWRMPDWQDSLAEVISAIEQASRTNAKAE